MSANAEYKNNINYKDMDLKDLEKQVFQQELGNGFAVSEAFPALMRKVYVWMTMALAISGVTAYGVASSPNLLYLILNNRILFFGIIIAELVLVWKISSSVWKPNRSLTTTTLMFIIFSMLNGATMSYIFVLFAPEAIVKTFFVTAGTFGATALYGYTTKKDLVSFGSFFMMGLIGLIIAGAVNIFLQSSMMDLIISIAGVVLFIGLTAWDSQQIKRQLAMMPDLSEGSQKVALSGALSLYLDFINLFIYLLRIFGRER